MASVKLEDGDVKGAVRLLCSDDRLAVSDESTFDELRRLHPATPPDRRNCLATLKTLSPAANEITSSTAG